MKLDFEFEMFIGMKMSMTEEIIVGILVTTSWCLESFVCALFILRTCLVV